MTKLDTLAKSIHDMANKKGFWDNYRGIDSFSFYAYKLAMIHSEVTEVLEAIRKDRGEQAVVEEIADVIIRVLDLYEGLKETGEISQDNSLDSLLFEKMAKNQQREKMHGVRG